MEDKEDGGWKSGLHGRGQRERTSDVSNDQEKVTLVSWVVQRRGTVSSL